MKIKPQEPIVTLGAVCHSHYASLQTKSMKIDNTLLLMTSMVEHTNFHGQDLSKSPTPDYTRTCDKR